MAKLRERLEAFEDQSDLAAGVLLLENLDGGEVRFGEWEHKGRCLIVVFCPERARKDAHERRIQVEHLLDRLARSDNPKELLSNHGAKRFTAVESDARLTANPGNIAEAER